MRELLHSVLTETLALWNVRGTVEADESSAVVRTDDGAIVWIERAPPMLPFRWSARWRAAGEPTGSGREKRPRGCASFVGVLAAMRAALGIDRGAALRVAPAARIDAPRPHAPDSASRREMAGAPATQDGQRIPVSVLTGFLGSGKTTLLRQLLRHADMGRTAVIVNEFGEIGLDHELVEAGDETTVALSTGCLCCKVTSDLALTLGDLAARRAAGHIPCFERVVIETSGLADPAPILHALMVDPALSEIYAVEDVIATVDAVTGLTALEKHAESVKQAALADTIVLTKTDVSEAQSVAILERLRAMNPRAALLPVVCGYIAPSSLFGRRSRNDRGETRGFTYPPTREHSVHDHSTGIASFSVTREEPLHAATLALFLSALAENCGSDLLRMKGIAGIAEEPHRPAVIHGVQHVYSAPEWLDRWPSGDRGTRMVFIGRNVRGDWVCGLLELLEREVIDACEAAFGQGSSIYVPGASESAG
jgi:G3E family GTPase